VLFYLEIYFPEFATLNETITTMRIRSLAALTLAFFVGQLTSAGIAAEPLDIPTILPLSGPAAFIGKEFRESLELLETRVNAAGGIRGRVIHFSIQDDESSPQVDVQLTNAALAKNPPVMIDGGPLALCKSTVALIKDRSVLWCLTPSIRPDSGSYVFAVTAATRDGILAALNYFKSRGMKKLAIMNGNDATGTDADAILAETIALPDYAGMSYVAHEHFNLTDLSVAAQVSRIKASGAQALITYTTGTPVATVLHGMTDEALDIPVFTSPGNMSTTQLDGYKTMLPKQLLFPGYTALSASPSADKGLEEKISVFKATSKSAKLSPDLLHAFPWDPVELTVEALKRAGPNATASQLRDALAGVKNWPGVFGRYDFITIPNRGIGVKAVVVLKWDAAHSTWVTPD
jgi:branched-chain amino acid transport system substrate-binding protein